MKIEERNKKVINDEKNIMALSILVLALCLSACGVPNSKIEINKEVLSSTNSTLVELQTDSLTNGENSKETNPTNSEKILIVYFFMPETSNPNNMTTEEDNSAVVIDGKVLGNTQYVATIIEENTGGDVFRIEPAIPYNTDHKSLVDLAKEQGTNNARPEIKNQIENLEEYDTIFVGYPTWWADMPMIMYSFFDAYDFSNKTIIPFNTHGGSGFANTIQSISELEPNATVIENGFTVSRDEVIDAENSIMEWLLTLEISNQK